MRLGDPSTKPSALGLAARLRALDDDALVALLSAREVREQGIRDFFDLADALLDPASVDRALSRLPRPTLAALGLLAEPADAAALAARARQAGGDLGPAEAAAALADLAALALVDVGADPAAAPAAAATAAESGRTAATTTTAQAYDAVLARLDSWPARGLPGLDELLTDPAPAGLEPVSATDQRATDAIAAERAFATTSALAQLVGELQQAPARELARGGIALPDTKRLAASMSVDVDAVPGLVAIASRAGLITLAGATWLATRASTDWMLRSTADRWAQLAAAWLAALSPDVRALLASRAHATWGPRFAEYVAWVFPAGGDWIRDRSETYTRDAEVLGIAASGAPSSPGTALLADGQAAAATAITPLLPPEVDRVYVQHDLTIVSPGPLLPRLDARLRGFTDVESRALAVTYRVTPASLGRALAAGETSDALRTFLAEISLTGIPQPLDYLLAGTAARFGSVRVGRITDAQATADASSPVSYVRSDDASLIGTLVVDQSLAAYGLRRVGPYRAVSRVEPDVLFWALNDAKYPVAGEDESGAIVSQERRRAPRVAATPVQHPAAALVERLRVAAVPSSEETGQAWLERQLDVAIRGKVALTVTVRMPGGELLDLQLEPASVAGGRLRARDRRSDLERTLPLSSIAAIAPTQG